MSEPDASALSASVFDEIEAALASTARGRAYLSEAARRARSGESKLLLDAVARLDRRLSQGWSEPDWAQLRGDFASIELAVRTARECVVAQRDGPAGTTETMTVGAAIAGATETIQDIAWSMRESGFDARLCDRLDEQTDILAGATARHDAVTGDLSRIVEALSAAEETIRAVSRPPGGRPSLLPLAHPSPNPQSLISGDFAFVPSDDADPDALAPGPDHDEA